MIQGRVWILPAEQADPYSQSGCKGIPCTQWARYDKGGKAWKSCTQSFCSKLHYGCDLLPYIDLLRQTSRSVRVGMLEKDGQNIFRHSPLPHDYPQFRPMQKRFTRKTCYEALVLVRSLRVESIACFHFGKGITTSRHDWRAPLIAHHHHT